MNQHPVYQAAFPSASRAATTYYSNEYDNSHGFRGAFVFTDLTARATGTLTVSIEGYDFASAKWYTMLAGSTLSSVTTQLLVTYPGATTSANAVAQFPLPSKWRIKAVVATDAVTFSVGVETVN